MAQKPDGKPAQTERVTFTRPAAERIAKVVRTVEAGDRDQGGLTFGRPADGPPGKTFRIATYTGAWGINGLKTVTLRGSTATLSAVNLFLSLPENGQRNCAVAKDGTAWHLIQWQWDVGTAVSSATLGTASLEFSRVNVASLGTASTLAISVTTCSTAAT
jgi:hypothetical protein